MPIPRAAPIAAIAVSLAACVAIPRRMRPGPQPMRISDPTQRIQFRGFSLLPPNGPGWLVAPPLPTPPGPVYVLASFGKALDHAGTVELHTAAAEVSTWDLGSKTFTSADDFLQYEKEETGRALGALATPRHRLLAANAVLDTTLGPRCVKYDWKAEDTGVSYAPGRSFMLEAHGYRCVHPRWPRYVIDVSYSERYVSGEHAFHPDSEVEPFLRSLTFTDDRPLFVTTIPVGNAPQGVVASAGSVWVAYGDDGVARLDPATNQVSAQLRVGRDPVGITAGFGSIWVANRGDGTVSRIDPSANRTQATIQLGGNPLQLAAGAGSVWVTNMATGEIERIDPGTNQVVARIQAGPEPGAVLADSGAVWVTLFHAARLVRIDPATNRVVASVDLPRGAGEIALGFGSLWVASQYDGTVTRLDPATNAITASIGVQTRPSGIVAVPDGLWFTRYDETSISRIDPRTNQPVGRPIAVGVNPVLMTFSDGALWIANAASASVSRLDF